MNTFENLGQALRWLRNRQNRKQYQIAGEAGITKAMLSAYETGKQNPSIDTLEKLLDALHVDLGDLFQALEIVNERPSQARRAERRAALVRGTEEETEVDVYQVLGIERPLAPLEEQALGEMLSGFHKLLRYYHQRGAAGFQAPPEGPPAP